MGGGPGRSNTLYLTAPTPEFERLSPVLGGLLADLKDTIHAWDIAGRRLDKPLLILIDEAGQLELRWLPTEVSTIAALGAFFVTCWQNLSQIQHRYGTLADAVLSGHRTKCFFAGVDDLATTRYLTNLLGSEYVTRLSTSADVPERVRRSRRRAAQRVACRATRRLRPAEHGPSDETRRSRAAARHAAADPPRSGALVDPQGTGRTRPARRSTATRHHRPSCRPVRSAPTSPAPRPHSSTKRRSTRPSPSCRRSRSDGSRRPGTPRSQTPRLPLDDPPPPEPAGSHAKTPSTANSDDSVRRRSVCVRCGTILRVGEGRIVIDTAGAGQTVTVCNPSCTDAATTRAHSANG